MSNSVWIQPEMTLPHQHPRMVRFTASIVIAGSPPTQSINRGGEDNRVLCPVRVNCEACYRVAPV
jgi:hypothetical protein